MSREGLERQVLEALEADRLNDAATFALRGFGPQILGYLHAVLRNEDAADEVFAQFSEELWKSLPSFRGESSFKTWAYQIVLHCVGRFRRDGFRRRAHPLKSAALSKIAEEVRSHTAPFMKTEAKDPLAALRASLDAEEQTLLFLRVDQQLSWREIATVMSSSGEAVEEAALRQRFQRVKERLSRELRK
jgi:RNA polymerase sigma-70 factor (ECF subfamily)